MREFLLPCVSSLLLSLVSIPSAPLAADEVYQVGAGVVDVTPDYPIRLNGFGNRREESDGVSQQIYAKALAISVPGSDDADTEPLVLITLDSCGIRRSMVDEVARRLAESHSLPAENLAVTFTHSHCTPKVNGAADNIFSEPIPPDHQQHIVRYTAELTDRLTSVAREAIDSRKPAYLDWAVGEVSFAKNRRTVGGPVDHDLPMLLVRDAVSMEPVAVYVSYACHCVTLSFNKISGDWAGYAAEMIERTFPGAVALVSIGAGSDQNPTSGVTGDHVEVAEAQGVEIATEVQRLINTKLTRISGTPNAVLRTVKLPLSPRPSREQLVEQTTKGRPTDQYNARTQLERLDREQPLISHIDYPIQTWWFGDSFCMGFLAGEVCVDYSKRLKSELDRGRFWLNAYSNDFCCYIPSERLLKEGGYGGGSEVPYFALPATLQTGLEETILDEVRRQVPEEYHVADGTQGVPPKSPEDSLQCISVVHNLEVQLAAAEPNVTDPVAIDFGPDGRLWVAEMNDYGRDVYEQFSQSGRIRWLRDIDNDGRFEQARTFADGLRFPTDVKVWRNGVLICDAPDILFARDTDGDGRADSTEKLFTGFEVRNAQARVNSLRFGLDGWVYGASGLFGGRIKSLQTGKTVDCSNRDFRLNPDSGEIQPTSGRSQQGRCRNDGGDWFGCSSGSLIRYISNDDDYLLRNPSSPLTVPPRMTLDPEATELHPPDNLVTFELSGAPGRATAACGLCIYRDNALGAEFQNDAFSCEPVHQSVHRIDFRTEADQLIGQRGPEEANREFLSSTDRWFRPVQVRTGPDGALWVVDMYRYVIEHPRWIPQASLAELDISAGRRRGRIYRVVLPRETGEETTTSTTSDSKAPILEDLTALSERDLVSQLDSSNGIRRDLVHQMLLWSGNANVANRVRQIAGESSCQPARIQALALLRDLKGLSLDDLELSIDGAGRELLRFAIQMSEPFLKDSPDLPALLVQLSGHESARLRRQIALSLGESPHPEAARVLATFLSINETDPHVRSAAMNSVSGQNVADVVREYSQIPSGQRDENFVRELILRSIRLGNAADVKATIGLFLTEPTDLPIGGLAVIWGEILSAVDARSSEDQDFRVPGLQRQAVRLLEASLNTLSSTDRPDGEYLAAIQILGRRFRRFSSGLFSESPESNRFTSKHRTELIAKLVSRRHTVQLQTAAINALTEIGSPNAPTLLIASLPSVTQGGRKQILDTLLSRPEWALELMGAIEEGTLRADLLNADRHERLLTSLNEDVRTRAQQVFGTASVSARKEVIEAFAGALRMPGSADAGKTVFRKRCASCHRLEEHGHVVGPDLAALTNRDPKWLLTAILDPNRDVDTRYLSWTAVLADGRVANGMIVEETAATIRLKESEGKEHLISRSHLDGFQATQRSLMPEGLERDMTLAGLRDVIAYLSTFKVASRSLAGNHPEVIRPDSDGHLRLTATTAEIRGKDITFEAPFANIGNWHHQSDSATWKVTLSNRADFDIYLNAACANSSAGTPFEVDGLPKSIHGKVLGTGGWDQYRQFRLGSATLEAGDHVITVRAVAPINEALFDLREIRLVPKGQPPQFMIADGSKTPFPRYPQEIAPFLLDESQPVDRRQEAIDKRPGMGPGIIDILAADLTLDDVEEEYRRIPWIWRVAIAVGRRNDGGEIRDLLELTVPAQVETLRDWQAVIIGGGLVNGLSQIGSTPKLRLTEILDGLPDRKTAWRDMLNKAIEMADDGSVHSGTRYDALRMVALTDPSTAVTTLSRYLQDGTARELQMGAVSGLVDVDAPAATQKLIEALDYLKGRNRYLAIEGLLRSDLRAAELSRLIQPGGLVLSETERSSLRNHALPIVRKRFESVEFHE